MWLQFSEAASLNNSHLAAPSDSHILCIDPPLNSGAHVLEDRDLTRRVADVIRTPNHLAFEVLQQPKKQAWQKMEVQYPVSTFLDILHITLQLTVAPFSKPPFPPESHPCHGHPQPPPANRWVSHQP